MRRTLAGAVLGAITVLSISVLAQDWYQASGAPAQRSVLSSAAMRSEFASIETDIADKLPALTGNGGFLIAVNSGGTALEALSTGITVAQGGTGATTAAGARTNLGLAIGTDVQAWDTQLDDIAALTATDSNVIVGNGTTWVAESGATARTSLGLAIGTDVQAFDADLSALAGLAVTDGNFAVGNGSSWVAENGATARTSLGLGSLATASTISDTNWSGTDLAVANGGTGASDAGTARSNLGVAIGSNVQAWDANLDQVAALAVTDSNFIVGNGAAWVAESGATARTSLGLGSLATASAISNDNWSGTDLAVVNGGTGASDAATARSNLGLGSISTQSAASVAITGGSVTGITDVAIADGGTGASTSDSAQTNLGFVHAIKTADETRVNNTLADDTHMAGLSLTTGAYYAIEMYLETDNSSAGVDLDIALQFSQTPADTGSWVFKSINQNSGEGQDGAQDVTAEILIDLVSSNIRQFVYFHGFFRANATTGGSLDVQWAQNVTDGANATNIRAGSWIKLTQMST